MIQLVKVFSDINRLKILILVLRDSGVCVCEICDILELSQPFISRHLKQIREVDILESTHEGKWVIYSFTANPDSFLKCWIEEARKQIAFLPQLITCNSKYPTLCNFNTPLNTNVTLLYYYISNFTQDMITRMVRLSKLHKLGAHTFVLILLILSISGFFLNHKNWNFLYSATFTSIPESVIEHDASLVSGYWIDPFNVNHIVAVGKRGLFESEDKGKNFTSHLALPCNALTMYDSTLFVATNDGIYRKDASGEWKLLALGAQQVNAMSVYANRIVASVEQSQLVVMDLQGKVLERVKPQIKSSELEHDITLARLIRDVHYGRGLFDGISSLLINDFGTIMLMFLLLSGMVMSILIYQTRKKIANRGKSIRVILKLHATSISVLAGIPLILIALSGILLDHSKLFTPFLKSVNIAPAYQPPVYHHLSEDIWSVDYDGEIYRIGNRHGIYQSSDLQEWHFENKGFAYKMIRNNAILYVSGMGAPNRILDKGKWERLEHAPHMFKDVFTVNGKIEYLKGHKNTLPSPHFKDATLYSVLFTLHDGSFFGDWWAYVNDATAAALVFLLISGTILWMRIKRILKVK